MNTADYTPVPVSAAKSIAEHFNKSQVVIIAADPVHNCLHHTTYGVSAEDKVEAAGLSEAINNMLTGGRKLETFQDFREVPAAEYLERIETLEKLCAQYASAATALAVKALAATPFPMPPPKKLADGTIGYDPPTMKADEVMSLVNDMPVFRELPEAVQAKARELRKDKYGIE